jgi:hypothetical protein
VEDNEARSLLLDGAARVCASLARFVDWEGVGVGRESVSTVSTGVNGVECVVRGRGRGGYRYGSIPGSEDTNSIEQIVLVIQLNPASPFSPSTKQGKPPKRDTRDRILSLSPPPLASCLTQQHHLYSNEARAFDRHHGLRMWMCRQGERNLRDSGG